MQGNQLGCLLESTLLLLLRGHLGRNPRTAGSLAGLWARAGFARGRGMSLCTNRGRRHSWRLIKVTDLVVATRFALKPLVCHRCEHRESVEISLSRPVVARGGMLTLRALEHRRKTEAQTPGAVAPVPGKKECHLCNGLSADSCCTSEKRLQRKGWLR